LFSVLQFSSIVLISIWNYFQTELFLLESALDVPQMKTPAGAYNTGPVALTAAKKGLSYMNFGALKYSSGIICPTTKQEVSHVLHETKRHCIKGFQN
jgi:hypothetical protein